MLSNKLTVSLMSLITILALVFIAPAVMAAFNATLAEHADQPDIGAAPGLQVQRPSDNNLKVKVMFAENVTGADVKANTAVGGFDMKGKYIPAVVVGKVDPEDATVKREFTVEITITAETAKVTLQIKKDIAAANAFSTNKSAALLEDIYLYGSEVDITPRVYGIRRADNSGLPLTSGAANVIITLSEMPQAFTAAEIDVMNGTAGTPVALGPIRQNAVGLSQFATHIEMPEVRVATLTQIRDGIFKVKDGAREDGSARDEYDLKGIEYYVSVVANADGGKATASDPAPATTADYAATFTGDDASRKEYRAEIMALEMALGDLDQDFNYHWVKDNQIQTAVLKHGDAVVDQGENPDPANNVKGMPIVDNKLVEPTKWATETVDSALTGTHPETNGVIVTIAAAEFDRSSKPSGDKDGEKPPKSADFTTIDAFNFAMAAYNARNSTGANTERATYMAEKKVYDTYKALQDLIAENRMEQREQWQEDVITEVAGGTTTQIAQDVLPPTGRDNMLHPYSVAITPSYATDSVVVKVKRWQNDAAVPGVYKPPVLETGYTESFDKLTIGVTPAAAAAAAVQPSGVIVFTVPAGVFK